MELYFISRRHTLKLNERHFIHNSNSTTDTFGHLITTTVIGDTKVRIIEGDDTEVRILEGDEQRSPQDSDVVGISPR